MSNPLTMQEINSLLSMRINNEPVFKSVELFYSDEYKKAIAEQKSSIELEKIQRFRPAVASEANFLYNDIHARDQKVQYSSGNPQGD